MYHWTIERSTVDGSTYKEYFGGEIRVSEGGVIIFKDRDGNITRLLKDWDDIYHSTFEDMVDACREDTTERDYEKLVAEAAYCAMDYNNKRLKYDATHLLAEALRKKGVSMEWVVNRAKEKGEERFVEIIKAFPGGGAYDFVKYILKAIPDECFMIYRLWM